MTRPVDASDLKGITAEGWHALLVRSIAEEVIENRRYPSFPSKEIQDKFVGSSYAHALGEAFSFYQYSQGFLSGRTYLACTANRYLDFGCGWGRIGRFFIRDFPRGDIVGMDIDPDMVAFCQSAAMPGLYSQIWNDARPSFAAQQFRLITAYSVFTHLPAYLARAWLGELMRLLAPGGLAIVTVEPPRFIDFLESVDPASGNAWHADLARHRPLVEQLRRELSASGIAYLASGGGECRTPDVYGETVMTREWIESAVKPFGDIIDFVDDADRFWQATVVIQRSLKAD